jgi:hypothetical protein
MAETPEHETTPAARPCASCAAPLADGQDWCLECGSAQPGRLGGRAGWRAALTVLALTTLLATGAVAAAYAALSSEARREAAAPAPPPAAPQVAQPPPQTAPPAETQAATPTVEAPESEPADAPEPEAPADDAAAATPAPAGDAGTGDTGAGATGDDPAAEDEPVAPEPIDLPAGAASTYDPYNRAAGQAGDPADALDGDAGTRWQVPVGSDGKVRIGLAVSLEEARTLSKVAFDVGTPGFTVEVYATRAAELPPDVLDARWEHVSDRRDVGTSEEVALKGRYRHVLLWITAMPADTIVRIPEVQVFG